MGLKRTDEFRQDAVRIALTSGLRLLVSRTRLLCRKIYGLDLGVGRLRKEKYWSCQQSFQRVW